MASQATTSCIHRTQARLDKELRDTDKPDSARGPVYYIGKVLKLGAVAQRLFSVEGKKRHAVGQPWGVRWSGVHNLVVAHTVTDLPLT